MSVQAQISLPPRPQTDEPVWPAPRRVRRHRHPLLKGIAMVGVIVAGLVGLLCISVVMLVR